EIIQENHYYPFGLEMTGPWAPPQTQPANPYRYNGKELNTDLGLDWYDYGARWYDPVVGRFTGVDPVAEKFAYVTNYNYAENEPVGSVDLWGLQRVRVNGNYLYKERNAARRKITEVGAFMRNPSAALSVGKYTNGSTNISSVSGRIARHLAEKGNMTSGIGTERNALRHVIWSAKMTQEFGVEVADELANAHEGIGPYNDVEILYGEPFEGSMSGADSTVDILNNKIGQKIGRENSNASTFELISAILDEYFENGFYVVSDDGKGHISIVKHKISEKQYCHALDVLSQLDENGFTDDEKK
ncbi:MAG: RHS repeat-associated core domain-containing protein, partial [Methanobacteriota archaeon]